jgi:hypothetical protein
VSEALDEQLLRYVARFDRREYWLAHEELEELWQLDRRDFYKGMIQIAAAFVHIERHNWRGAKRLLTTGLGYIESAAGDESGFDVARVRTMTSDAAKRVGALSEGASGVFEDSLYFALSPLFAGEVPPGIVGSEPLPYRVRRYANGYRPVTRPDQD